MYTMQSIQVCGVTARGATTSSSSPARVLRRGERATPAINAALSLGSRHSAVARGAMAASALKTSRRRAVPFKAHGTVAGRISTTDRWWEKGEKLPNLVDINNTEEFLQALGGAGDQLVVVDFYAQWCAACRAMYPKLHQIASQNEDVLFLKVNFEANKQVCKSLSVKVLPYFHLYRGSTGRVAEFSCSITRVRRLREAIAEQKGDKEGLEAAPHLDTIEDLKVYAASHEDADTPSRVG